MAGLKIDLRYVMRVLAASPVFTTVAVLSLAIGIGANTVLFSVARFALLDPLPVDDPAALRIVQWAGPAKIEVSQYNSGGSTDAATGRAIRTNFSHRAARELEGAAGAELFAFNFISQLTVTVEGRPALAAGGLMASGRYFPVLRPPLALGRGLGPADDDPAAPPAAVLSHAFWQRAFGGDPNAVGATIAVNGSPFSVVGVTAPEFRGLSTGTRFAPLTDVTVPIAKQPLVFAPEGGPLFAADNRLWLRMMARLPPGAEEAAVARDLTAAIRGAFASAPFLTPEGVAGLDAALAPGERGIDSIARGAATPIAILAAVVGVVLLIACVNLAGLSLARGAARQRELAVRRALGASRGRLVRQLILESTMISALGGLAGVILAASSFPAVGAMVTSGFGAPAVDLPLDWRTLALTAVVSTVAGLLFGLFPAIGLTRPERTTHLRHGVAGRAAPRLTIGRALLALQIGISVPLVVVAGLLLGTIRNLTHIDLGFNADGLIVFRLDPTQDRAASADVPRFARELIARVETVPGVSSATLVENALVSGWVSNNTILVDGERKSIFMNAVGPRYFETMQIPLRAGRAPTLEDTKTTAQVGVVNETAARALFGTPSPIGRRFRMGSREIEIVGVAADSKYSALRTDVVPTLFDPFLQRGAGGAMHVVVRARGSLAGLEPTLRRAVADVNPNVPISELRTQADQVDMSMGREQLLARLMTLFGGFALVLACIGLYGATSYAVARRTNEIGVRIALGAQRSQVLWLVLRQVLVVAIAGLVIGIPVAFATGPLVGSLLYGLGPRDPATIVVAAVVMVGVALAAGILPARRAANLPVVKALRQE
jgi:predicted permease